MPAGHGAFRWSGTGSAASLGDDPSRVAVRCCWRSSALRHRTVRASPAALSGARRGFRRRDVEPLGVEPLVERPVMGGEPGQLVGVRDGVRVSAVALLDAGAGSDIRVPAGGPSPLGAFARLPCERLQVEGQLDGGAVGRQRGFGSCDEVVGVDDDRAVSPRVAHRGVQLVQRLEPDVVDAHVGLERVEGRGDLLRTADEEGVLLESRVLS